jgi:predicted nucleic acid-binding protein
LFTGNEEVGANEIQAATSMIRQLNLNLRAPDAINLAVARRLGASIATFDRGMTQNAGVLGIAVAAA